jgi:hypothetical protein
MIKTGFDSRVKIQQVVESQLPDFVLADYQNTSEFLKQYYISQEYQGGPVNIAENLDQYLKLDNLVPEVIVDSTYTTSEISTSDTIIHVNSTKGFPKDYGLLKIDNEIITYTGITTNTFNGCIRGFSGITSYHANLNQEELVFSESESESHANNSSVQNLSSLFLKEFYKKIKYTFTPGLENVDFISNLNVGNFIKNARSFYQAKGTDDSFRILFNILYGVSAKVINLEDFLIKPSSADFIRREIVIAERISGDPSKLIGQTIKKNNDDTTSASISEVEIFTKKGIPYYKISLFIGYSDISSVEGNFQITPNTKCLQNVSIGSSIISVDSTIGFPSSGIIFSGNNKITYSNKSINQFFDCSGIDEEISLGDELISDEIYYGYEDGDTLKKVELKFLGTLSEFTTSSNTLNLDEGQIISIKNLGDLIQNPKTNKTYKEIFANSWIYNTSSRYQIQNINNFTLKSPIDRSSLKVGDQVEILIRNSNVVASSPTSIAFISEIKTQENRVVLNNLNFQPVSGIEYDLRRKINTARSTVVPIEFGNNTVLSDVQNLYTEDNYAYVASNSLPSGRQNYNGNYVYTIEKDIKTANATALSNEIDDRYTVILFANSVPFITGDRVYYEPSGDPIDGLETGDYYVEVQTPNNGIRLYASKSFIGTENYLSFLSSNFNNQTHKFTLYAQRSGVIGSQKLLKKFDLSNSIERGIGEETIPGSVGMLINGVEISNYKSDNKIYYGPLKSVNILNPGSGYDVANPPNITVSSGAGITALIQPIISGSIEGVYVDSQNYDIDKLVSVRISGGNGSGCQIEPIITKRQRSILFDARTSVISGGLGGISTTTNQITFLTDHNLDNGDSIIYNTNSNLPIGIGTSVSTLINNSLYYAKVDNNRTIRIYESSSDYLAGINTITFNGQNCVGIHKFVTSSFKNTISEIKIINGGTGYTNRKLIVSPTGISTVDHTVNFNNHGFNDGEIVNYTYQTSTIGISTLSSYFVLKNDDNSFRLCDAGIGATNISNFNRKNYVRFSSIGSGYQYFSYPDISVDITYTPVGFGTTTQVYQSLVTTPIVRGSIVDAYLYETGTGYGSTVLNFEKKPSVSIKTGKEAQLKPLIENGIIYSVSILYGGLEYYSTPDLIVVDSSGSGTGASLRPIISDGRIKEVKVINGGIGYSKDLTKIIVSPAGYNVFFDLKIRELTVSNYSKFGDQLLLETKNKLQYSVCGYFNNLRNSFRDFGDESSKIIGWAYDGNPIYGSYGYSDPQNISEPKRLISGYTLNISNIIDRPEGFAPGFFVEDYEYTNSGDLDENNGRFCKTPEFPDGIYAYFATIDAELNPQFPYFIGNRYRSETLDENSSLDQTFDFNNSNLLRNTLPYKVSDDYATNDFLIESNEIRKQQCVIESVTKGFVNDFEIINAGLNYQVGDVLNFDESDTGGGGLISRVSSVKGKNIVNVNTTIDTYNDSIFTNLGNGQVKVSILPYHNLSNNDFISISGISTNSKKLDGFYNIKVTPYYSNVLKDIPESVSGLTTEIYVTQIPTKISVGSSILIGNETLSVLEVFNNLNIIKVKRGVSGVAHTSTTQINFLPDSFIISKNIDYLDSKVNDKVYFNPSKSIGVGTITGITTSVVIPFGDSEITRFIPTQGIYIENHPFSNNQAIKFVIPDGASNISISTSPDGNEFDLPEIVYVTNKNKNTIGIRTNLNSSDVYFINNGSNNEEYLFESLYNQEIGTAKKVKAVVSVSTYHELVNGDIVTLNIKPDLSVGIGTSSSIYVKVNETTKSILINPIGFSSTGINTVTNEIALNAKNLKTGDKVLYSSDIIADGLSNDFYYVYKINDNTIKLCQTYNDSISVPPTIVNILSTGGENQNISIINPQIKVTRNNDLVFDLSDNSLSGYNFKLFYDEEYKNEFISIPTSDSFTLSGIGTIGISTNASLTIKYDDNLPSKLFYGLKKFGNIIIPDKSVNNYSEILFVNSIYNTNYNITGVGSTSFTICLLKEPEKLEYLPSECTILNYSTLSPTAKGPIDKINIVSGGSGYRKLPLFVGSNSVYGENAYLVAKSTTIGNSENVRVIDQNFEYSSDKTLEPTVYIPSLITIKNSNTIGSVEIINAGRGYIRPPSIIIVDSITRKKIDTGIIEASIVGDSINSVSIVQSPKGISESGVELFAVKNTNGVIIQSVESISNTSFICYITTPTIGFSKNPFIIGSRVFIEGIEKDGTEGTGFNSEDYGCSFFTVSNYDNTGVIDAVTIDASDLTTNTGVAKIIQDTFATIVNSDNYPVFKVNKEPSPFLIGEEIIVDDIVTDLKILSYNTSFIRVSGSYDLSSEQIIKGKESGNIATVDRDESNTGRFKVNYSSKKDLGWSNNTGKLDEDDQVIQNNDYYQNLSYTVKSPITYHDQKTPVNNLVHSIGFKNFADTEIMSTVDAQISFDEIDLLKIYDIVEENRVDAIHDFDLVTDIDVFNSSSRFLKLKNKKISDYTDCISNVVLKIDDITNNFSNLDGSPSDFVNIFKLESSKSFSNILVRSSSLDNSQIQLTELILLNDGNNSFLAEKGSVTNIGPEISHVSEERFGKFSLFTDIYEDTYLRFIPKDPYNIDYDIKILSSEFNTTSLGIGSTLIGFNNLISLNVFCSAGLTTSIISLNSNKFSSLFVNVQVIDSVTNQMNFVELYLNHDGNETYMSEYYFDSESSTNFFTGNSIGTFGASLSSGVLTLNYTNNSSRTVLIRSKIVGFGTESFGINPYRFILDGQIEGNEKSIIYESNYLSTVSSASTILSLNKIDFNAVKSLVEVSVGSTSALHQLMVVQDMDDVYIQQSPFLSIGSTSGIGTFGAEYSGDNFILKFYPDQSISSEITITSFSQCLYTILDNINIPPDFKYGVITETLDFKFFNAVNGDRINRTEFVLTSDGNPIFAKTFNPTNTSVLNPSTGVFTIRNHYFSPQEKLTYTPKSTFIGIGQSAVGIGATLNSVGVLTTLLPSDVYVIKIDDDKFKLSTRPDYASLGIAVTFTSYGLGNAHVLEMDKKNEKTLITIDNLVQYPLLYTPLSYSLYENGGQISAASTIFSLSGIASIAPSDIIKIDNEYMKIENIGFGTTSSGPITNNGNFNLVQVSRGSVGTSATIHLDSTEARVYRGSYNIINNTIFFTESPRGNPQLQKNSSNLEFESSDFSGRVFLRNNYESNKIYDDISDQFTGIGKTFTLTVSGENTVGLGSSGGNGLLFINSIFQTPTTTNNTNNNFIIIEDNNIGVSSVVFSGITDSDTDQVITSEFDVNQNQTPRGGLIISLSSTNGLGYAPLVGANIRSVLDENGSIVNVVGIATTGNPIDFTSVSYDNTNGILNVFTPSINLLTGARQVKLVGLGFTCPSNPGIVSYFPSNPDKPLDIIGVEDTYFSVQVGISTLPHTYVGFGTIYPWYSDLTFGSGYNGIRNVSVTVTEEGYEGPPAEIEASVGIGGSLSFTVNQGGLGYVNPQILVSEPSYENLEIVGLSRLGIGTTTDTGVGLLLNVEVGASSTTGIGSTFFEVTRFNISRQGYAFQRGDVFKPVGLVTDARLGEPISELTLTVIDTFTDSFAMFQVGEFDYIDSVKNYQNGTRTRFPLFYNSSPVSFESSSNPEINFSNLLFITINGVVQEPGTAYQFDGGTSFLFTTPPKPEDNIAIFFYRGTIGEDSKLFANIRQTIKEGDDVQVLKNNSIPQTVDQNERTVINVTFSDKFETNIYSDGGIDTKNYNPLSWFKQKIDKSINGENLYKSRDSIECLVYPTANIIKDFSSTDTEIFVDNVELFEYDDPQNFDALIINGISTQVNGSIDNVFDVSLTNGCSGIITGIAITEGTNGNPLALKFYINGPIGFSNLQAGYPIYIYDTNVGEGVTSIDSDDSNIIGIGTTCLDNIYYCHEFSSSGFVGIITCNILSTTPVLGITSYSSLLNPIGKYSWGRMSGFNRSGSPISISVTGNTIDVGLSTFPTIQRRGTGLRGTGALPKQL